MIVFTQDNFPEIKSEPNWIWTWCIRVVFFLLFGSIVLLFYITPVLFCIDGTIEGERLFAFGISYYPIVIWLSYVAIRYLKRLKSKAVRHITENSKGVFFEKINSAVEPLLYSQLEISSNDNIVYDVFIGSNLIYTGNPNYRQIFLNVFLKGNEQKVHFLHPDVAYSYYARNSRLLRSPFIQGITLFRPDLRIAPNVYSEFSIHPQTFEFDKRGHLAAIVMGIIILIFICIEWYMKYRFGDSLLF